MKSRRSCAVALLVALVTGGCSALLAWDDLLPQPRAPEDGGANDTGSVGAADDSTCPEGFGDCDDAAANGCETNLKYANDPTNCGACGRSCGGARCASGACEPIFLADAAAPSSVVVDSDWLYWASSVADGGIWRVRIDGGTPELFSSEPERPFGLAADEDYLYWTTTASPKGHIRRAPKQGGPTEDVAADAGSFPKNIVVSHAELFWTAYPERNGLIATAPSDGGTVTILQTNLGNPYGIAVDDNDVYCAVFASDGGAGAVLQIPRSGTGNPRGVSSDRSTQFLTVDGANLFWTAADTGRVYVTPLPLNGSSYRFADRLGNAYGIAVDDVNAYWMMADAVMRLRKDSPETEPVTLAYGDGGRYLAVDDAWVYFTTGSSIAKTPK